MVMDRLAPPRTIRAQVFSAGGTALGAWPALRDDVHFSLSSRANQGSLEFFLPWVLGRADMPNEAATLGTVQLGNRVDLHVSSPRTLGGLSIDSSRGGGGAADLSRIVWTGNINAIGTRPDGVRIVCSGGVPPAASGGVLHLIPPAAMLDWDLEVSTYLTGKTYTGWVVIAADGYDIDAVRIGDTMRVYPERILDPAGTTRYDAYEDAARTVSGIDWSLESIRVSFDTPPRDLLLDQVAKIAPITLTDPPPSGGDVLSVQAQMAAAGGLVTKVVAGTPTDANLATPEDGAMILDSTAGKLWSRVGGTWKFTALT